MITIVSGWWSRFRVNAFRDAGFVLVTASLVASLARGLRLATFVSRVSRPERAAAPGLASLLSPGTCSCPGVMPASVLIWGSAD